MRTLPRSIVVIVPLLAALWLPVAAAQEPAAAPGHPEAEPGQEQQEQAPPQDLAATGDAWLDAQLADINHYGRRYRGAFIDELVRYRDAPRALVVELLDERGWEPGDVYFACSLAGVTGRSCRFIANRRGQPPITSWEALATELGAGPGSGGLVRLKRGVVHSYGRWARPLELDAELAAAFPDHGQPPAAQVEPDG